MYPQLEASESTLNEGMEKLEEPKKRASTFKVDADEDRPPRTLEEMEKEAEWLASLFEGEGEELNGSVV